MKLNPVERFLMNSPVRAALQRHIEAADFERLGGKLGGERVLEVGCGRGIGLEILIERSEARQVHAFDLDRRMVSDARVRLARRHPPTRWSLFVGDATAIPVESAGYDAVIDSGVLHHVVDWRSAIGEVRRVLRPGGRFCFLEVSRQCLDRRVVRTFLKHPREDRFSAAQFAAELEKHGIGIRDRLVERWRGNLFAGVGVVAENAAARL